MSYYEIQEMVHRLRRRYKDRQDLMITTTRKSYEWHRQPFLGSSFDRAHHFVWSGVFETSKSQSLVESSEKWWRRCYSFLFHLFFKNILGSFASENNSLIRNEKERENELQFQKFFILSTKNNYSWQSNDVVTATTTILKVDGNVNLTNK